jgi:hypothetical protein
MVVYLTVSIQCRELLENSGYNKANFNILLYQSHRQKCESSPSSSEDLKLKNDVDLPEFMPLKSVRLKRDY